MTTDTELCKLLPWYANGTLDANEMDTFSQHLESCPDCIEELEQNMELSRIFHQADSDIEYAESQQKIGLSLLKKELSIYEDKKGDREAKKWWQKQSWLQQITAIPNSLVTCVLLVAIGITSFGWWNSEQNRMQNQDYNLLTNQEVAPGPALQIVFEQGTNEQRIQAIIEDHHLSMHGLPSQSGVYQFGYTDNTGQDAQVIAAELLKLNEVKWVGIVR